MSVYDALQWIGAEFRSVEFSLISLTLLPIKFFLPLHKHVILPLNDGPILVVQTCGF